MGQSPGCTGRTLLHFEASDYNTSVYLNKQLLGHHAGGYDPFVFDATAALNPGVFDNELLVGVLGAIKPGRIMRGPPSRAGTSS